VVTVQGNACVAPTHDQAVAEVDAFLAARGLDLGTMAADEVERFRSMITLGDPAEIGEIFSARLIDGVDGFTLNAAANGHIEGRVALLGEVLTKVVGG
jgi:hypothetical protein